MFRLLLLLSSLINYFHNVSGRPQPQINYEMMRPDLLPEYKELVKKCVWKKTEINQDDLLATCPGIQQECTVPIKIPAGVGYMHISRLGPYETTGGFQQILCVGRGHRAPKGSWLIRAMVGPVDPHTNELIEFPPLHIHHLVTKSEDNPVMSDQYSTYLPYVNYLQAKSSTPGFPSGVSDAQCIKEYGGIDCLLTTLPPGYGRRVYGTGKHIYLYVHMQDVRKAASPPISHYVDYGEIYITLPNPLQPPLKPTIHGTIEVIGPAPVPYTYFITTNTSMYNFATYFIPTRTQMVGNRMHWHSVEGDEAWIVRGTQTDLGIPEELQQPVKEIRGSAPEGNPIAMKSIIEMEELKVKMEKQILFARDKHAEELKKAEIHKKNRQNDDFLSPKNRRDDYVSPKPPEILCKFYGKHEEVTKKDIEEKANKINLTYKSVDVTSTAKDAFRMMQKGAAMNRNRAVFEFPGVSEDLSNVTIGFVERNQQEQNLYTGVLPGQYYRAALNSNQLGEKAYSHCDTFQVEAGEYLTLIHFNMPRIPAPSGHFDGLELVQHQHSIFMSNVYLPDIEVL